MFLQNIRDLCVLYVPFFKVRTSKVISNRQIDKRYSPIFDPVSRMKRAPSRLYRASVSGSIPSLKEGVFLSSFLS